MSQAKTKTDLWGQDAALDERMQAKVAANGELVLTDGPETGEQDIRLRLFTRLGSLFYDTQFGSLIHDWILEESTEETRAAFCAEVVMRIELDPRVVPYSVTADILAWNERQLVAQARWRFIGEDQPFNLVMQLNKITREILISDVNPDPDSFSANIPQY
jgi:phage baseplate assembly protein W